MGCYHIKGSACCLEWLLGIGLIVVFVLLVKSARFGFIRDLLGF